MKAYLEPQEVAQMEKVAGNLRDKILIRLLFRLGCRITEALSTKADDIDFIQGTVTIIHLKHRLKLSCSCGARLGAAHVFCPKCGSRIEKRQTKEQEHRRQRVLPIDSDTLKLLKEYIEHDGLVIRHGKRLIFGINRHRAWQIVKECAEKAGLPKLVNPETGKVHNVSPHKLRDAFSVMAVKRNDSGDGLRLLQEHLGHQRISPGERAIRLPKIDPEIGVPKAVIFHDYKRSLMRATFPLLCETRDGCTFASIAIFVQLVCLSSGS